MPSVLPPPVPISQVGRAAHDLGLAGLLGGNLYGRLAMHPSVTAISDERERGKVINAAWRRYGTINALSLAAVSAGWLGARLKEADDRHLSRREARLARAKDVLVGATAVTGLGTAVLGMRFAKMAPGGGVPLLDGDHTAPGATRSQAKTKRAINALGTVNLLIEAALVGVNAALNQEGFRRPPKRRLLSR
jgi:uncharacterized membrane protein